ncbi:MAG: LamG domain-containing protein [Phycisphaerales bacterium JB063]
MIYKHTDFQVPDFGELTHPPREALGYRDALLSRSPEAYWPMGEASETLLGDLAGGHTLALSGEYTLGQGPASPSADDGAVRLFNGKAQAAGAVLPTADDAAFSLVFWIRRRVPYAAGRFMSQYADGVPGRTSVTLRGDGRLRLSVLGDTVFHSTIAPVDQWTHAVLARDDSGNACWYVNGELDTTITGQSRAVADVPFILGLNEESPIDVELDEVAVFHAALSSAEVAWLYRVAIDQPVPALEG